MTKNETRMLEFVRKYPGWHSIGGTGHPGSIEKKAAVALENRGLIEIARHSGDYGRDWQMRTKNPAKRKAAKKKAIPMNPPMTAAGKRAYIRNGYKKTKRAKNPMQRLFKITAQRGKIGPKMHYDGTKFSQRARVKLFASQALAEEKARALIAHYPVLQKYAVRIESNF